MNERVLQEPSRAGIFHLPKTRMHTAVAAAQKAGLKVLKAKLAQFGDRSGVLDELGHVFNFPDWYGCNFDALHDCLTDPDWQPAAGCVLVISGLDKFRSAHPDDFRTLIEVLRSAIELRRENGTPLWVLLDTNAPEIPTFPDA